MVKKNRRHLRSVAICLTVFLLLDMMSVSVQAAGAYVREQLEMGQVLHMDPAEYAGNENLFEPIEEATETEQTNANNVSAVMHTPPKFIFDDSALEEYVYVPKAERESTASLTDQSGNTVSRINDTPQPQFSDFLSSMTAEEAASWDRYAALLNANTHCSSLPAADLAFLCEYSKVSGDDLAELEAKGLTLIESLSYAKVALKYEIPAGDLFDHVPNLEGLSDFFAQMNFYLYFINAKWKGNETDTLLRGYLLKGYSVDEVLSAYSISRTLDIDMDSLFLPARNRLPNRLFATDKRNYELLAEDLGVRADTLAKYALENGLRFYDLEKLTDTAPAYTSELFTSEPPVMAAMTGGSDPGDTPVPSEKNIGAPYSYDYNESEKINLNSGAMVHETVDYTLPGVNGLDLIIGRRYDSDVANVYAPSGYSRTSSYYIDKYYVYWSTETWYEVPFIGSNVDYKISEGSKEFSSYQAALDFYNTKPSSGILKTPSGQSYGQTVYYVTQWTRAIIPYRAGPYEGSTSYYSTTDSNTYLNDRYGLGTGWSFLFSSIQDEKYLYLADGRSFEIQITAATGDSNLKNYTLTDLRLERENSAYSNGSVPSMYTLYYKDGRKEYFAGDGRLIGIKDRYNNAIKFSHDTLNGQPRIVITDTLNRVTTISSSSTVSGIRTVTVALPNSITLKYTVSSETNPVACSTLTAYSDPMNVTMDYYYTVSSAGFSVWNKNTNDAVTYYMNLIGIKHPTGAFSKFTYDPVSKNLGSRGLQTCFRITSRKNEINTAASDEKAYSYSGNNYSGWPVQNDPTNLPADFNYSTIVKTAFTGLEETHTFDSKHLTTSIKSNVGAKKVQDKLFDEYNPDKLPVKVTTKTYDDTNNNNFVQAIELAEYDTKGNIIASWTPLANGNKSNTEYKTTYVYDLIYSQLKSVSYKQNASTTITKTYTLDSGNLHPLAEITTVGSVQKSKTEWGYDTFGNVRSQKRYKDDMTTYDLTEYEYQDNAYLSLVKTGGVRTADGANAASSPGYSSGVIATKYKYNTLGRLEKMTDPRGYETSYSYNAKNDLTKVVNPDGSIRRYDRNYTGDAKYSIKYLSDMTWTRDINSNRKQEPVKRDRSMAGLPLKLKGQGSSTYAKGIGTAGSTEIVIPLDGTYQHFICDIGLDDSCSEPYTIVEFSVYANNTLIFKSDSFSYYDSKTSHLELDISGARELRLQTVAVPIDSEWEDYYLYDSHLFYADWADAKLTKQTLEPGGSTVVFTNEVGRSLKTTYTPLGLEYETVDSLTNTVLRRKAYDALSRLSTDTDLINNSVTTLTYDYLSRVTDRTVKQGSATLAQETYAYAVTSDGLFKTTKTQVGDSSAPSTVTTSYVNNIGLETKTGKFLNGIECLGTVAFDYIGNKVQSLTAQDASQGRSFTAKWEYDHMGQITRETNTLNQSAVRTYDALGRNMTVIDYSGSVSSFTYDALGRLLKQETPFEKIGRTVYTATKKYDYDPSGNITREQTQSNAADAAASWSKTEYDYNNRGLLITVDGYDGSAVAHKTQYTYDTVGKMLTNQVGTGAGNYATTTYTYDSSGNPLTTVDPLGQTERYTYDMAGHIRTKTDRNGATATYTYDGLGRPLTTSVVKGGVNTGRVTTSYTLTGQVKTMSNDGFTVTNIYDSLGRLKKETETSNVVKDYTYGIGGNREGFTLTCDGVSTLNTTYEYDELWRLKKVKENGVEQASYTYDTNGNRKTLTEANGVTTSYEYNLSNLVTSLQNKKGAGVQSSFTYVYYLDGNQKSKSDNTGRVTGYTYDGLGRLTREAESGAADAKTYVYAYDARSNRQTLTVSGAETYTVGYSCDLNDRLFKTTKTAGASGEITTYRYDSNGNTLSSVVETLGGTTTGQGSNTYNGLNQLVSTVKDGVETTYAYKPDGLRWSKTTGGVKTTHVWDGQNIVAELKGSSVVVKYLRGVNLIWAQGSADKTYYSYNAHGDVVQLTDAAGTVTRAYRYDAFGVQSNPDTNDGNPFRYCGEYLDSETGSIYLRARYYLPRIGRFTQQDLWTNIEIDNSQSLNLYTYCWNNPLMYSDATGQSPLYGVSPRLALLALRDIVDGIKYLTKEGYCDSILSTVLGAEKDAKGIYHIRQDWWQSGKYVGYNDGYDYAFDIATSMSSAKFEFNYNNEKYMLWAWKGDYVNLGAGAELGIYYGGGPHWLIDTNLAMPMTLKLLNENGNQLFYWTPAEKNWWITGFDPSHQGVSAQNLIAIYTIDFSWNKGMFSAFSSKWGTDPKWTFNYETYIATFKF